MRESFWPGNRVSHVAQRYGLNRKQLSAWRALARKGKPAVPCSTRPQAEPVAVACRKCEEGVAQAPVPAHLIEGGLPTEGMLAHVMVSRFADHWQAQIYARSGVDLRCSTLGFWVGKGSFELRPVYVREGRAEDVEQPGAGRDHGPGTRPGSGQDRLHVDDGTRRARVERPGPAWRGV